MLRSHLKDIDRAARNRRIFGSFRAVAIPFLFKSDGSCPFLTRRQLAAQVYVKS